MDQLSAMRVFVRVVETGNFTRAAATLNMPKTTVTNLVQSLESHLRTTLLNRTTRKVMVTTDGALYYERAMQILSELDELDGSMSNSQRQPSGRLRVEMAGAFADLLVIPNLCDFHKRFPQIRLDIGVGDRLVDYIAENVDCALRAGTPTDQSLIARKVGEISMSAYAAPLYIRNFGAPERPQDLQEDHLAVGYLNAQSGRVRPLEFHRDDENVEITPRYVVSVNDSRTYVNAAISGMGIVQAPRFMVREAVEKGELVEVLSDWQCGSLPLYIVYPQTRHLSNKVRVFVDWLAKLVQNLKVEESREQMRKAS
ncbi:LysR family transcriptional regulator [Neorhizobium galegae]|uniref:LysR family transcriptional regulator n=1 Tax=Neorhizobium galegae TaxID=399 RepID=UPI0006221106|nr:LysR family transcriptional regulator [Neorhizobium galegae]CDZ27424.1 Transcriptional regulator, LysR family [Neorhizobium galegae bv. officinalis]KAA9387230.1 LysR family transcriptional regulator [Neorhizobium galegae]KAB1114376.1 LysR family transcriptional regulator [Neorhizobium galegae]MCM2497491.1 LysR family transcriptional regulator [Neorhizobium galegae]MCQ1771581.1 LysR family transcriptional regulator [Neorhizobium galegae]